MLEFFKDLLVNIMAVIICIFVGVTFKFFELIEDFCAWVGEHWNG